MTKDRIIYQVDAFTIEAFKGNPAGVCILDKEMPEEWMRNVAAELHVSETAFITCDRDEYKIRYFTPEAEVLLCGHATLSSALGIDEDPVTGSAHCALVPFWHRKTSKTSFTSHQVSKRGGIIKVALLGDRVEITDQAKNVFRAELYA
jgi:predicted PhzF superfamily epimerase YddE/YHI9